MVECHVEGGKLPAELDFLDDDDGGTGFRAAEVLEVGGEDVGLAPRGEVLGRGVGEAGGDVPAVGDWDEG